MNIEELYGNRLLVTENICRGPDGTSTEVGCPLRNVPLSEKDNMLLDVSPELANMMHKPRDSVAYVIGCIHALHQMGTVKCGIDNKEGRDCKHGNAVSICSSVSPFKMHEISEVHAKRLSEEINSAFRAYSDETAEVVGGHLERIWRVEINPHPGFPLFGDNRKYCGYTILCCASYQKIMEAKNFFKEQSIRGNPFPLFNENGEPTDKLILQLTTVAPPGFGVIFDDIEEEGQTFLRMFIVQRIENP